MPKYPAIIGLVLLLLSLPLLALSADPREAGVVPPDGQELQDKSKEDACDCCNNCRAAKGTMKSQEDEQKEYQDEERKKTQEQARKKAQQIEGRKSPQQEGKTVQQGEDDTDNDGCEDCCTRCGKELKPQSQEAPPEVIEHKLRPELQK